MTVIVTDQAAIPRIAPAEQLLRGKRDFASIIEWEPRRAASGPLSIVVSAADGRAVVLRNGTVIGTAAIAIQGSISRTTAYILQSKGAQGRWLRIILPDHAMEEEGEADLRGRIQVPEAFRRNVEGILSPDSIPPIPCKAGNQTGP